MSYEELREEYKPDHIKVLLIAESPPPDAHIGGSRHFYRSEKPRREDRLFNRTMQAIYPEAADMGDDDLQAGKEKWLRRFQKDGWYMTEALEISQRHSVKKPERQAKIKEALPRLIERVRGLAEQDTKIILIKSNVFDVAAEPLREAGFTVLNEKNVDYPGVFNHRAYREKLAALVKSL